MGRILHDHCEVCGSCGTSLCSRCAGNRMTDDIIQVLKVYANDKSKYGQLARDTLRRWKRLL